MIPQVMRFPLVLLLTSALLPSVRGGVARAQSSQEVTGATGSVEAQAVTLPPGQSVAAETYAEAPQPSGLDLQRAEEALVNSPRPGPAGTVYEGPAIGPFGAPVPGPNDLGPQAVGDFAIFRSGDLPPGGQRSAVGEPSTAQRGKKRIFATGNWYAARKKGANWSYFDPFTIFGPGFCCDQVTLYEASHDRFFWLLQYSDHLVLANATGKSIGSWCYYTIAPTNFGLPANYSFDYNHMAASTRFIYVSTNVYDGSSAFVGALVFRFPIDEMSQCGGFSAGYVLRSTEFSVSFVQPATDMMIWGTNWTTDLTLGSTFRVLRWADDSGSYSTFDRTIDSYAFLGNNQGTCGSQNGVVLNWCQRTDSRQSGGGYFGFPTAASTTVTTPNAVVGFAFNAKQDGTHPRPYIRRVFFRPSDLAYVGAREFWNPEIAYLYPDMAADARGHVGMIAAWGGGDAGHTYYPGAIAILEDDYAKSQPWDYNYFLFGAGNPCLNPGDNLRRWGDYLTIHNAAPGNLAFIATGFALASNAGACNVPAQVVVRNIAFGRERDRQSYNGWK